MFDCGSTARTEHDGIHSTLLPCLYHPCWQQPEVWNTFCVPEIWKQTPSQRQQCLSPAPWFHIPSGLCIGSDADQKGSRTMHQGNSSPGRNLCRLFPSFLPPCFSLFLLEVIFLMQFIRGPWSALLPAWKQWVPINRREVGYHPPKRRRHRDRFTEEEVNMLQLQAREDVFDHALFTFFLHSMQWLSWLVCLGGGKQDFHWHRLS